jgi:hypothetical protein
MIEQRERDVMFLQQQKETVLLRSRPFIVLINNGERNQGYAGQQVHFARVDDRFVWQSFELRDGRLSVPETRYGGVAFVNDSQEAESLFRRLAASNGFTVQPQKLNS